ncbi:MAG: histidine--tRNA ligase [Chloroflexi bacterium]|nr:histidine--tRNA ligase [Chloroflexota bacterium]MBU1662692.1 histidine--tRNA ligase [Chloroflexota bacterium]
MKKIIPSLTGTRDFYPQEMAVRSWLYQKVRQASESFGYQEYEGPCLETIELYAAKSGDELVKEQSFVFPDRGGDLIALRPELTPTLVRMVAQKQRQLTYPLRWWSFGPFWRYERPQRGRTREFFQWNIDLIGIATPEADAEIVAVMAALFKSLGLTPDEVAISVNNRRLVDSELAALGIAPQQRASVSRLIDRKDKLNPDAWDEYAIETGLTSKQLDSLKAMLDNQGLWEKSAELVQFFAAIEALGVQNYVRFNPQIIRGLDYYTGTVYEAQALTPDIRRAVAGGGRYDNLMADVGGDPLPGTGFAMGDVVITLLLEKFGHIPQGLDVSPAPVLVTIFDEASLLESFKLAAELRQEGLQVACYPAPAKLGKQFKYADRIGARLAVILGPDELSHGHVAVKDLKSRDQHNIPRGEAAKTIREMLAGDYSP